MAENVSARPWRPLVTGAALRRGAVFAGALAVLLLVWAALALVYSRDLGSAGATAAPRADPRDVVAAATSSIGRSGQVDTSAVLATDEYFRALALRPAALGADPRRGQIVVVSLDTHTADLPVAAAWAERSSLTGAGVSNDPRVAVAPVWHAVLLLSDHHQSVALQFPTRLGAGGSLALSLPPLEADAAAPVMRWNLPLRFPEGSGAPGSSPAGRAGPVPFRSMVALLAVMAGLLVVFSPCALHLTGVFLPLVTGLGMKQVMERRGDSGFRRHTALLGVAFVSGFVVIYTVFGAVAGLAGQLVSDTTRLRPLLEPVRIVAGLAVVFLALQALGLFRLPFVIGLGLPGRPQSYAGRQGYLAAALTGINVSTGCLACVGGTLLASLLLYAGSSGSALTGALTLFLFSLGVSLPFLMIAVAFDSVLPRIRRHWGLLRHSATVAAAVMLVVGLLIMSGSESVIERLALPAGVGG